MLHTLLFVERKPFRARTGSALRWRDLLRLSKHLLLMNLLLGKNFQDTCGTFLRVNGRPPKKIGKIQKIRPNRPQIHPKSTPQPSQDRSKIASGGHLGCLSVLGRFFAKICSDLTAQDRPKTTQRSPQDRPKTAQDRPKIGQDPPGAALGRLLELQVDPSWPPRWLRKRYDVKNVFFQKVLKNKRKIISSVTLTKR